MVQIYLTLTPSPITSPQSLLEGEGGRGDGCEEDLTLGPSPGEKASASIPVRRRGRTGR